jgi:ketosteroid isomerase-like protein
MRVLALTALLLACWSHAVGQTSSGAAVLNAPVNVAESDLVVQDILAQDKLILQATLRHDLEYLDKHITADARFKSGDKVLTKHMLLAAIIEQKTLDRPVRTRYSAVTSQVAGDVVNVTATVTLSLETSSGWRDFLEIRATTGYKKIAQEWVIVASENEYEKPLADIRTLLASSSPPSQQRASGQVSTQPCGGIEMMGLYKNEVFGRAMGGGIVEWLAKIRNNTTVTKLVIFGWIDQYGQQQRAQVQLQGGSIASPRLDLTQARYIAPVRDLRVVSCE